MKSKRGRMGTWIVSGACTHSHIFPQLERIRVDGPYYS